MDDSISTDQEEKEKYLEPTFHFTAQQVKIGDDYTTDKIPVSELVKRDQLLVGYPDWERFSAKGYQKEPVELGENVHLSEDEESILASVPGYPKIRMVRSKEGSGFVSSLMVEPLFIVSPDLMKVTLSLHPPLEEAHSLKNDDLNKLLAEQGIIYGLDKEALEEVQQLAQSGENEFNKVVIAQGQPVGKSSDAYLKYDMEIGPVAGTTLEDGSIDFRDRKVMVSVHEGQRIATKTPAVQGEPGIDVFGEETPAKEGKDLKIQILNDARFSQETQQITAARDGVVSVVNNNVIKVLSHSTVTSDIDFATGNIKSANCITIQGSVQPGFKAEAGGDLKITGSVMSAYVSSAGNMVISGGITGKKSTVKSDGDVDINIIEQGKLSSGGLCVIRKQSYYSDIFSGADIRCKPLCKVIGGRLVAEGSITLGDVGSENATPSVIAAGVVADRLDSFFERKQSVVQQQDEIIQWLQRYRGSSKSKKIRKMEKDLAETKSLLLRLNLIPGTGIYSKAGDQEDDLPGDSADYISDGAIEIDKINIDVFGEIHTGTEIRIGNRQLKIEKTVSARQFKLHPSGKRIIAVPLKKKHR